MLISFVMPRNRLGFLNVRCIPHLALATLLVACDATPVSPRRDPPDSTRVVTLDVSQPCPQTYEFGNYGCARIVVLLSPPPGSLPPLYRLDIRAHWATPPNSVAGLVAATDQNPALTPRLFDITLWDRRLVPPGDTASLWLSARILEDVRPVVIYVPLPVFPADSVLRPIHFAPVGSVPRPDTLQFILKSR
jgi:hypothetical protein